jgi:hypothetical protein
MATFPTDQFDDLPETLDRVGAHRGPRARGAGWIWFAWAVVGVVVLSSAGLYALSRLDDTITFAFPGQSSTDVASTPSASATPLTIPITDPTTIKARKISVTVLNGTPTVGLQNTAASVLSKAKWKIASKANASESTVKKTVVYYSSAKNKDVALGIVSALGIGTAQFTDVYRGAPITVVLGIDYQK